MKDSWSILAIGLEVVAVVILVFTRRIAGIALGRFGPALQDRPWLLLPPIALCLFALVSVTAAWFARPLTLDHRVDMVVTTFAVALLLVLAEMFTTVRKRRPTPARARTQTER